VEEGRCCDCCCCFVEGRHERERAACLLVGWVGNERGRRGNAVGRESGLEEKQDEVGSV
jgi:hypothetical protein